MARGSPAVRVLLGLALGVGLMGCASLEERVAALETRNAQSCIYTVAFPWPFAVIRSVTATGGATIEDCQRLP